jgi:hypothetical protein
MGEHAKGTPAGGFTDQDWVTAREFFKDRWNWGNRDAGAEPSIDVSDVSALASLLYNRRRDDLDTIMKLHRRTQAAEKEALAVPKRFEGALRQATERLINACALNTRLLEERSRLRRLAARRATESAFVRAWRELWK